MDWYKPTHESISEHRTAMGENRDDGGCITLCGRRRRDTKIFCLECSARWRSQWRSSTKSTGAKNTHDWALNERLVNIHNALWPEWV